MLLAVTWVFLRSRMASVGCVLLHLPFICDSSIAVQHLDIPSAEGVCRLYLCAAHCLNDVNYVEATDLWLMRMHNDVLK